MVPEEPASNSSIDQEHLHHNKLELLQNNFFNNLIIADHWLFRYNKVSLYRGSFPCIYYSWGKKKKKIVCYTKDFVIDV